MFLYRQGMPNVLDLAEERDPEAIRIGGILRNLRGRDRTLQDLGAELGRTHGYLSKVERGFVTRDTQLALIPALARVYGIQVKEILNAIYPPNSPHQRPAGLDLAITAREEGER